MGIGRVPGEGQWGDGRKLGVEGSGSGSAQGVGQGRRARAGSVA